MKLSVIDASGTIPSGVTRGNFQFLGDFDECMEIKGNLDDDHIIEGQYCSLQVPMSSVFQGNISSVS